MIMHDSVQREAVCLRDLNIASASIEWMTLTLGGLTALLHEQLSYFQNSLSGMVAR